MKQLTNLAVLLAIAAAMATTVISCSSDNDLAEQPQVPTAGPQTVHVTVGAGMAGDSGSSNSNRSAVVTDGGVRTLTFTEGDRLFVYATVSGADDITMTGYLSLDETPAAGATTARFSGDLTVYKWDWDEWKDVEYAYTFSTADPLGECEEASAILVHRDAVGFEVGVHSPSDVYKTKIAATVDELMTKMLSVEGEYDGTTKSFMLSSVPWPGTQTPIFNCNISGLTANTTYTVTHVASNDFETAMLKDIPNSNGTRIGSVTADADGKAAFVCYVKGVSAEEKLHLFTFKDGSGNSLNVYLGSKSVSSKVYNVSRKAVAFRSAPFSVGSGKQVYFSKGNLKAAYDSYSHEWYWNFHDFQWQYVGNAAANTSITAPLVSSESYKALDLFGWNGASSGNDTYGINNSTDNADYGTTSGEQLKHDWGHNAIDGYAADTWRTLTADEWTYLLNERTVANSLSADARYTMAVINGTYRGVILFPDNYVHPDGTGFVGRNYNGSTGAVSTVTHEGWALMEGAGCVFLPAAYERGGTTVGTATVYGSYWANSSAAATTARKLCFYSYSNTAGVYSGNRNVGCSVRLVRDVE